MTRVTPCLLVLACMTVCGAACSSDDPSPRCPPDCPDGGRIGLDGGAGGDAGGAGDAGGGGLDGAGGGGACPEGLPDHGASCALEGRTCQYGARLCPTSASCTGGTWSVLVPPCVPPPPDCPATRESAAGMPCMHEGDTCEYPERLLCGCTTCPNPYPLCMVLPSPVWACEAPNADPQCPDGLPPVGAACAPDGQICDYGCEMGMRRVCTSDGWVADSQPGGCPVSSRRAKRDIVYLDDEHVDALAADVARTRLATYEYVDPALRGRRRLGFILEDQASSFAVDPERSQVDLYGYTSMLVAAVQSQQRQIDSLQREVAALRARRSRTR